MCVRDYGDGANITRCIGPKEARGAPIGGDEATGTDVEAGMESGSSIAVRKILPNR